MIKEGISAPVSETLSDNIDSATFETDALSHDQDADQEDTLQSSDVHEGGDKQGDDFVPFPKKAKNLIAQRDRKIAKLKAQLREMQQPKAQPAAQTQPTKSVDAEPKEEDFDNYGEYIGAKALYNLRQEIAEQKAADEKAQSERAQQEKVSVEQQRYVEKRTQEIAVKAQEYVKQIPDFAEVLQENAEFLDYLPESIQNVFYEAEDAALAFYNLAREGKLAELADMTPTQAARAIARAEMSSATTATKTSRAPRPMRPASGTGQSAANLSNIEKDANALRNWLNQ